MGNRGGARAARQYVVPNVSGNIFRMKWLLTPYCPRHGYLRVAHCLMYFVMGKKD